MNDLSWSATKRAVYERAGGCCEYCRSCDKNTGQSMEVEHIDPNGGDIPANLCLSCGNCNRSKAITTTGIDPETGNEVALFNPRTQRWSEHFVSVRNLSIVVTESIGCLSLVLDHKMIT